MPLFRLARFVKAGVEDRDRRVVAFRTPRSLGGLQIVCRQPAGKSSLFQSAKAAGALQARQ